MIFENQLFSTSPGLINGVDTAGRHKGTAPTRLGTEHRPRVCAASCVSTASVYEPSLGTSTRSPAYRRATAPRQSWRAWDGHARFCPQSEWPPRRRKHVPKLSGSLAASCCSRGLSQRLAGVSLSLDNDECLGDRLLHLFFLVLPPLPLKGLARDVILLQCDLPLGLLPWLRSLRSC